MTQIIPYSELPKIDDRSFGVLQQDFEHFRKNSTFLFIPPFSHVAQTGSVLYRRSWSSSLQAPNFKVIIYIFVYFLRFDKEAPGFYLHKVPYGLGLAQSPYSNQMFTKIKSMFFSFILHRKHLLAQLTFSWQAMALEYTQRQRHAGQ